MSPAKPPLPPASTRARAFWAGATPAIVLVAVALVAALWPSRAKGIGALKATAVRLSEPGRGRSARSPGEIPLRGWGDILWRAWQAFHRHQIPTVAGGMTFFLLLALFPGAAAFLSLCGLFADVRDVPEQVQALASVAPPTAVRFLSEQLLLIASQRTSALSLAFATTLAVSVWSSSAGMRALFHGLNIVYEERERRGFLRLTFVSLVFTAGGLVFLLAWVGAVTALPVLLPFMHPVRPWLAVVRWPVLMILTMATLAVVYRYGPSREHARWRWVTWGAGVAAALWLAASFGYSWYVAHLAHFDRTFGSLGAAFGGLIWLWLSSVIILLGAELDAEIEHQTTVDSTTGAPRPMGVRGAVMADTAGKAPQR